MIGATAHRRLVIATCVFASTACGSKRTAVAAAGSADARPRLRSLRPESVQLLQGNVTEVDLRGSGFDTSRVMPQNTVRIGGLVLRGVPSDAAGNVIRVAVPALVPGNGEAPPMPWLSGRYAVTVTTPRGTSDTLTLSIAPQGGRLP